MNPLHKLDPAELEARQSADAAAVLLHRDGLRDALEYVRSQPDIFPAGRPKAARLLARAEKEAAWSTWQRFVDYLLALETVENGHRGYYRLKGAAREDSFQIGYAAMLARYRAALEFIDRAERNPELDKVLNDPVPELGLPGGSYAKLKFRYLNVAIATDFAAREVILKTFAGTRQPALRGALEADARYVWQTGRGRGELLTLKNALKIAQRKADSAWLPIQTRVAEWMGQTKVNRRGRVLITPAQIDELRPKLEPGDVLLERREWYMSNIGLPGFWAHAAIYIGTPDERRAFFTDANLGDWLQAHDARDLEQALQAGFPEAYRNSAGGRDESGVIRIIEAIGPGVSFTSLEHSAACDSLAVLRPRLPKAAKALAVFRAFRYAGRPYDYRFDFSTDSALVCTELVFKAYEPGPVMAGWRFPLVEMLGRKVTPANELARQFDAEIAAGEQQTDLVLFLDGRERDGNAAQGTLAQFRESWKRPKWHVLAP